MLIHGAGGGGWEWNLWRGVLIAQGLQIDAPDLRPAPAGLQATTFDDYLAQVREALHALPRPRAVVGGRWSVRASAVCWPLSSPMRPRP